jgi:DNA polymerase III epsilon subunit-like protein
MRLLGLDTETTGLDLKNDRVVEVGAVLWDTDTGKPLKFFHHYLFDEGIVARLTPETLAMMARISGISEPMLREFGEDPAGILGRMSDLCGKWKVDAIVAHNGNNYDKPLLLEELVRHGVDGKLLRETHWLDTKVDIPWPTPPDSNKLKHLALEQGFINPFAHRAIFDVLTMLRVLQTQKIDDVIAYSKIPNIVIRAVVPKPWTDGGKGKDSAKAAGYRWQEVDYKIYEQCWVKKIKHDQLDAEKAKLPGYQIVVLD